PDRAHARAPAASSRRRSLGGRGRESRRARGGHAPERAPRRSEPQFPVGLAAARRRLRLGPAAAVRAGEPPCVSADPARATANLDLVPPARARRRRVRWEPVRRTALRAARRPAASTPPTLPRERRRLGEPPAPG